jgi:putative ABC transport system permease protein
MRIPFQKKEKHAKIKMHMIIFLGWRNLRANKTRSFLTVGGVSLGIGIITFLLCIGFGIQGMIIEEVTKNNPRNVMDINNGNLDNFVTLNNDFVSKIENIEGIKSVARQVSTGGKIEYNDSQIDAVIYGENKDYLELARTEFEEGEKEFRDDSNGVIASMQIANILGFSDPKELIGKKVKLGVVLSKEVSSSSNEETTVIGNEVEIVGITESQSSIIIVPFAYLNSEFSIDSAQRGKILIEDTGDMANIELEVQQLGFLTESINEIIEDINSFFVVIRVIMIVLGVIIMSISAMGMLNTLSISLLQRTKEVGILKALGTKREDIFKMFIFEAILISVTGGLLGLLGGYGLAIVINKGFIFLAHRNGVELSNFVYIPYYFVLAIVSFILFLGLVTGLMPAQRAAKIHALDALRYE